MQNFNSLASTQTTTLGQFFKKISELFWKFLSEFLKISILSMQF
jgi:hypothetical protein